MWVWGVGEGVGVCVFYDIYNISGIFSDPFSYFSWCWQLSPRRRFYFFHIKVILYIVHVRMYRFSKFNVMVTIFWCLVKFKYSETKIYFSLPDIHLAMPQQSRKFLFIQETNDLYWVTTYKLYCLRKIAFNFHLPSKHFFKFTFINIVVSKQKIHCIFHTNHA